MAGAGLAAVYAYDKGDRGHGPMTRLGAACARCDQWVPLGGYHKCSADSAVLTLEEPVAAPGKPRISELVVNDLVRQRHPLPWAGRDYMNDAYKEALDLVLALRLALYERDGR